MTKIDFFQDHDFKDVQYLLDTEIKRLQSKGLGFIKHQAEVILSENYCGIRAFWVTESS